MQQVRFFPVGASLHGIQILRETGIFTLAHILLYCTLLPELELAQLNVGSQYKVPS